MSTVKYLGDSFHPAPKPGTKADKLPPEPSKPATGKPKLPEKATEKAKSPPKKAKKPPLSHAMRDAYVAARNRARVDGGYVCEYCAGFLPEGQEHAHHIVYGRLHGTRSQHTTVDELAIVGGDFSGCKCHAKIHQMGIKDPAAFQLRT